MSQSVRPPPAARAFQLARVHSVQTLSRIRCGIYYSDRDNSWITKCLFVLRFVVIFFLLLFIFILCVYIFLFYFFNSELKKQPAVMARDPEHVSKLTESTFKVSDAFSI